MAEVARLAALLRGSLAFMLIPVSSLMASKIPWKTSHIAGRWKLDGSTHEIASSANFHIDSEL
jgi:hypothetical protein